ncbi:hypothetical protein SPSIL_055850 [Sporomusa silvacetica DSM 10669]|uniref:Spore coat associated protein JA (CotJA) n=1 Tax=Sporomusa silvacetica DSM 10669 TaxID=1123289 RepID=A0ABZ3IUL2_9FIRM|nr:spore coat associated protein CotJA [Sporomusa silvacetica]OZC13030.1 spore coat associated protein CotJA [Sporomusa silvacetica DSM 10669]
MKKKTRHQMYSKSNVMKMQGELHDMDDMCEMDDMDDMDDDMEDMVCEKPSYMGCVKGMDKDMCGSFPECIQLAHSYVPWQTYEKAFTPCEALMKGTLFPELWGVYRIPK